MLKFLEVDDISEMIGFGSNLVGTFKNCLFDDGVFNIRDFLRNGASNNDLKELFLKLVKEKPANGFIAELNRKKGNVSESMSTIGG